jgi:hypothetical protein
MRMTRPSKFHPALAAMAHADTISRTMFKPVCEGHGISFAFGVSE